MREGRSLPRTVKLLLLALGVLALVAIMYLAARFVAWAFGCLILYVIIKGVAGIFRWRGKG